MKTWISFSIFVLLSAPACELLNLMNNSRYTGEEDPYTLDRAGRGREATRIALDRRELESRISELIGKQTEETAPSPETGFPEAEERMDTPSETAGEPEEEVIKPWGGAPSGNSQREPSWMTEGEEIPPASGGSVSAPGFSFLRREQPPCGHSVNAVEVYLHASSGLEFVLIPGGRFMMGSTEDEPYRHASEGPRRWVTIEPFLLCKTECTWEAFQRIGGRSTSKPGAPEYPVNGMKWTACIEWCERAGNLRLPTEAEWEYACRAGTDGPYYFDPYKEHVEDYAWYGKNAFGKPQPVATKKPNPFGLHDMLGNVGEWCEDSYIDHYERAPTDGRARINEASPFRIWRGGHFRDAKKDCRCAARYKRKQAMKTRYPEMGFRPACSVSKNRMADSQARGLKGRPSARGDMKR
jgi:formylglycine-generating enzyme required for sulfatase activity